MQAMGCELTAEDIYSINHSSLKDAIVSFGGFCTGEFISSKGLVLTNHHCGYGQIQKQSSMEHNYLKDGFWANSMAEELKNPGLFVEQLVYMEDVTNSLVNSGDKFKEIEAALIEAKELDNPNLTYKVVPFFGNNQFFLLATIKYNDVRLVGAPPSSIGKYGADTDNWVFPSPYRRFQLVPSIRRQRKCFHTGAASKSEHCAAYPGRIHHGLRVPWPHSGISNGG